MGRNHTGPPCSVVRPTAHVPSTPNTHAPSLPAALQTTDDNDRCPRPLLVCPLPLTLCVGGPVITECQTSFWYANIRCSVFLWQVNTMISR